MKSRFLDLRNCHELLPSNNGLALIARLEECLQWINRQEGRLRGSIDSLIRQNERTIDHAIGSKRLCMSPIEIAQNANPGMKTVHTQAVERNFPGPGLVHIFMGYGNGMAQKATIPLQYLLKGWGDAASGYQGYVHALSQKIDQVRSFEQLFARSMTDADTYYYVGITGRNWLLRLEEHVREMRLGNRRLFYSAWRERYGTDDVIFTSHLMEINLSFQDAMNWEEMNVDRIASDQYGLNMIPGGFKGLKFLHECRLIGTPDISLEERERAISEYVRQNPRKGIPNPFLIEQWKTDELYLKLMDSREKTLSPEQVRLIRELHRRGNSCAQIVAEVGALNEQQVKNVISGKTYGRIK